MVRTESAFSKGLDLGLLGSIVAFVGWNLRRATFAPTDPTDGPGAALLAAMADASPTVGAALLTLGVATAIGGPIAFWVAWPLYRRVHERWRRR